MLRNRRCPRLRLVLLFLVFQQFFDGQPDFLNFVIDLQNGEVVGLAKQEGHRLEKLLINVAQFIAFSNDIGENQGVLQLLELFGAKRNVLQPHHRTEITTEGFVARVVASRTEERIGKFHESIVEKC